MFIVMVASTHMPSKVKARYLKVALVEIEAGFEGKPKIISERARGVKRIVELRDRLHAGSRGGNTAAGRQPEAPAASPNRRQ